MADFVPPEAGLAYLLFNVLSRFLGINPQAGDAQLFEQIRLCGKNAF